MDSRRCWEIRVDTDEAEWKRALNRFWFRTYAIATWSKPCLIIAAILVSTSGVRTVFVVSMWIAVGLSVAQYCGSYFRYRRRSLQARREPEDRTVTYRFSDDGVALFSEIGSSELRWRAFDQVWRYSDMWLLVMRKTQYLVLPTRCVPEDLRSEIARWMRLGGGGRPTCRKCGYDLRGQRSPRCPECGASFDEDTLRIKQ